MIDYHKMARTDAKLSRGMVWCHRCGFIRQVNSAYCLANGWPACCGETMSLDSPMERAALVRKAVRS